MRSDQVDEQQAADEIAAGEHRYRDGGARELLQYEERVEEFLLHAPDAELHLRECRPEDQNDREGKQDDRQLERDEEVAELADQRAHGAGSFTLRRKLRKSSFCPATSASGPISLKNQVSPERESTAPTMRVGAPLAVPTKSTTSKWRPAPSKCWSVPSSSAAA